MPLLDSLMVAGLVSAFFLRLARVLQASKSSRIVWPMWIKGFLLVFFSFAVRTPTSSCGLPVTRPFNSSCFRSLLRGVCKRCTSSPASGDFCQSTGFARFGTDCSGSEHRVESLWPSPTATQRLQTALKPRDRALASKL